MLRARSFFPLRPARTVALGLLVAAQLSVGPRAEAASDEKARQRERLEQLQKNLDDKRAALRDLDGKERSLITTLGDLDRALADLSDELDLARSREEQLVAETAAIEAELATDEQRLASTEKRLHRRLRALYVLGEGGAIRHLLGAESFTDLSMRRRVLRTLADADARLVSEHARIAKKVRTSRARLRQATLEASATRRQIQEQTDVLAATRKERAAAIMRIDREKELAVRKVTEIVDQQRAVRAEIAHLIREDQKRRRGVRRVRALGGLKNGLAWPVRGPLLRRFGTSKDEASGATVTSNGVHIRSELGTPIGAPADGRVVHVGWLRGFGRMVILDHGDGTHSLLAHMSKAIVTQGEAVKRGQTVGFVGDTESTDGPKLYLELRHKGRPRNPTRYLR